MKKDLPLFSELEKKFEPNLTMNCVICSTLILEKSWIDLTECCDASIHNSCLEELGSACPSCGKDLDIVVLNILEPNDVGTILDSNNDASGDETYDMTVPIFDVNKEAEPIHLHFLADLDFENHNSDSSIIYGNEFILVNEDIDEQQIAQELFRRNVMFIPMESEESSDSDDETDNPNDPDWDISQQTNSDDSN